jgi:CheY-like chemotaxis protein
MSEWKPLDVLFPGPRRPIFAALYAEPGRWWSLPELSGRAGVNPATLRRHLALLRDAGLVREKADGGRPWFQANPACPVHDEMRAIVTKLTAHTRAAETILIVEDQEATAQITRILLESWGYRVLEAHSGAEALEIFKQHGDAIELVLTDVIMPGMSGPQIAGELVRQRPGLRVAYMSGYPSDQLNRLDAAFLPKPFNPHSLSRMIRRELDRPANGGRQMKGSSH